MIPEILQREREKEGERERRKEKKKGKKKKHDFVQESTNFPEIWELSPNSRDQKVKIKQVLCSELVSLE